jgi:hypothetical protein
VFQLSPSQSEQGPVCFPQLLRVSACVKGTCGDGVCEVGENVKCGCDADCPDAKWGPAIQ